jgi:hypothetical protein
MGEYLALEGEEVEENNGELYNEDLHSFYFTSNTVRLMK